MSVGEVSETSTPGADVMSDEDVQAVLARYLDEDDRYDMDDGLAESISNASRVGGIMVVPPGESGSRMLEPLTESQEERFGEIALRAAAR